MEDDLKLSTPDLKTLEIEHWKQLYDLALDQLVAFQSCDCCGLYGACECEKTECKAEFDAYFRWELRL